MIIRNIASTTTVKRASTPCPSASNVVLGIDPGIANCGWALLYLGEPKPRIKTGTIRTRKSDAPRAVDTAKRIDEVVKCLKDLVLTIQPNLVAIEGWNYQGPRTRGRNASDMPRLVGRIEGMVEMSGVARVTIDTNDVKRRLGAVASCCGLKTSVQKILQAKYGASRRNSHEWDALAVAHVGVQSAKLDQRRAKQDAWLSRIEEVLG